MSDDSKKDWEEIEPLLDRALDLEDTDRTDFLDEIGEKDPLLLDRLRSLLRASEGSDLLIDKPLHSVAGGLVDKVPIEKLDPALGPGKIVGVYRILEELGEGGMGRVFLAERADGEFRQRVALKVLNERADLAGETYSRFRRERQILADLKHEGIARLLDGGVTRDGRPFFVLEYVDGEPLVAYCERKRLSANERIRLVLQVCEALHYAHQRGVVHRDLKPSNLLVEEDQDGHRRVCVLDFGIAHHGPINEITLTGQIMGTPGYMSPEQAKGLSHLVDSRSDVFSLGVLLYELLSGRQPFGQGEEISAADVLLHVAHASFEPIRELRPEIEDDLEAIVERCLAKRPDDRYDSMRSLARDLEAYVQGHSLDAHLRVLPRIRQAVSRRPLSWAVVVALLAGLTVAAWLVWRGRSEARERLQVERLVEQAREIGSLVRSVHLSEVDDLLPSRSEVELRLDGIETGLATASPAVRAAGEYALGAAALELGDSWQAIGHLRAAWQGGLRSREVASALAQAAADRATLASTLGELLGDVSGEPVLADALRTQLAAATAGNGDGAVSRELGEAVTASFERRHRDVLAQVELLVAREPWRYDALLLAAASASRLADDLPEQRERWHREALRLLQAAAEQGRSDPRIDDRLCGLALRRATATPADTGATAACRRSLRRDPRRAEPHLLIAAGWMLEAGREGLDEYDAEAVRRALERAVEAGAAAARLAPGDPLVARVTREAETRLSALEPPASD